MSSDLVAPVPLEIPEVRRRSWRSWLVALAIACVVGVAAIGSGLRQGRFFTRQAKALDTVVVDRGDLRLVVTENGTLESADNATVRCEVEAILGLTGGAAGAQAGRAGTAGAQAGQQGGAAGNTGAAPQAASTPPPPPAASKSKAAMPKGAAKSSAKAKAVGAGVASNMGATGAATPGVGATAGAAATGSTSTIPKPNIQSFNYIVEPHIPLRPKTSGAGAATKTAAASGAQAAAGGNRGGGGGGGGGGGRGGSGGGRGGGGGGNMMGQEQPGSTRILSILPEGTRVKAGDVVCELDSAAFKDELSAQKIRFIEAKAWVDQAKSILEVNEIARREYDEGIYPQDLQLIRQYISACETDAERARRNLIWAQSTQKKGFRTTAQVKADALALQQAETVLAEANGMLRRLQEFTGKRINTARRAKLQAIRADQLSLESSFQLEKERLDRLEKMISNCTLRAPRDGIVVYANQTNPWGRVDAQIQEGVTVHQTQPIFNLPNPKHMQVKAKVNETKVSFLRLGQPVLIRIDAFPDRPLRGTVQAITAIPAPTDAMSDVRVYYATVSLESGGFDELRPGLSAEVHFEVDSERDVTRVPLQAVRWIGDQAYAALATATSADKSWQWKPVVLGMSDSSFAAVISGLKPGDRIIADAESLPAPTNYIQAGAKRDGARGSSG